MPFDLTPLDAAGLALFLIAWSGYNIACDGRLLNRGLNHHLLRLRLMWMLRMIERPDRITDANLLGHTIHSASFFASTTMLVLAGLVGVLGAADRVHVVIADLSLAVTTTRGLFEVKLLLLIGIFVYAFFRFTWAIRQFNYCLALIGGSPLSQIEIPRRLQLAEAISDALSLAILSFNSGLRSYYFALAAMTWLAHPTLFIVSTIVMFAVQIRRQFFSRTLGAIERSVEIISAEGPLSVPPERKVRS